MTPLWVKLYLMFASLSLIAVSMALWYTVNRLDRARNKLAALQEQLLNLPPTAMQACLIAIIGNPRE